MHDPPEPGRHPVLADQGEDILPGIRRAELLLGLRSRKFAGAAVDDDRLLHLRREPHLGDKSLLLDRNLRIVKVVIVEPDLPDSDAAFVFGQHRQLFKSLRRSAGSLLRMNPRAGEDSWQAGPASVCGDLESLMHRSRALANPNGEDRLNAGIVGPAKDLVAVRWSLRVEVEVGVRVNEWHFVYSD